MKKIAIFVLLVFSFDVFSKDVIAIKYLKNIFGIVHQNPSHHSQSLTTISCNHPVKILKNSSDALSIGWAKVKVGPYTGYIKNSFLGSRKIKCFQDKYPKFFDQLELGINEFYYWGKLYDQFTYGKSKVK